MLMDYLSKYAQKAYKEINSIITSPVLLFSNDPNLTKNEAGHNYTYIHGFNGLIKNNRITKEKLIESFTFLEEQIKIHLMKYYKNKDFIFYLNADALVPAFTLTVVSHYESKKLIDSVSISELIDWYKEHACFNGLEIVETEIKEGSSEQDKSGDDESYPDSVRTYLKIIKT